MRVVEIWRERDRDRDGGKVGEDIEIWFSENGKKKKKENCY